MDEALTEPFPAAGEAALDCAQRPTELLRGRVASEAFQIAEKDGHAIRFRQPAELFLNDRDEITRGLEL